MPPCNINATKEVVDANVTPSTASGKLQLNDIRKALPAEVFVKSDVKAVGYMIFDYVLWFGTVACMQLFCNSDLWKSMPLYQQIMASVVYFNVAGFFMWCVFMIGHDAGHGTFSDSTLVNDVIGHIAHGSLLVPFFPWQLSHRRHHMYHNHVAKDYSYPWITEEIMNDEGSYLARLLHSTPLLIGLFPFFGWPLYIFFGQADGNHFIPIFGRLWKDTPYIEQIKGIISSIVVVLAGFVVYRVFGPSLANCAFYYLGPWVIFTWWLICVTYLQHHDPDTLVYDDKDWTFVDAAFETVDRKYGTIIDTLSHHITDGHVIHHLFFTKIPHYNLPKATKALQNFLKERNLFHKYRYEDSWNYFYLLHKFLITNGFRAVLAADAKRD